MESPPSFVDLFCHILPADGPHNWDQCREMLRIASADGIARLIATPEQSTNYPHHDTESIRDRVRMLQQVAMENGIPVEVLPGAVCFPDLEIPQKLHQDQILSLGDHRQFVLLDMPRSVYLPLEPLVEGLRAAGQKVILANAELNLPLQRSPELASYLVDMGVHLMITGTSLLGGHGQATRDHAVHLIRSGLVAFLATGARASRHQRPLMRLAFDKVCEVACEDTAVTICCHNPEVVFTGTGQLTQPRSVLEEKSTWWLWRRAG